MGRIIGIDLGTTNSLAAYWENGESKLIPNALGEYLTPSVVSIDAEGLVYVGKMAKDRLVTNPESTVSVFKRSMGTDRIYKVGTKNYRAEELSAIVLKSLKEDAERYFGEPVEEAIISVPAYFNDIARKATRKAGQLAGLRVDRIINEPSAAALACQMLHPKEDANILVFDFGGGTLDVSLVECMDNIIEIVAVSGNNFLGGSDFDKVIAEHFCKENGMAYNRLTRIQQEITLKCAEKVKQALSDSEEAVMKVSFGNQKWELAISRKELIQISGELFRKMAAPIKRVMLDGEVSKEELSQVVLVGGSCKMPIVQQYLRFLLKDVEIVTMNPDYMIAVGMGVYTGIKERKEDIQDLILTDICPFSLGIKAFNETDRERGLMSVLIPRNSPLPASYEATYRTVTDGQRQLTVSVYQGEDMYVENNLFLGKTSVNVPPAPEGKEKMNVRFTYDINGLLVVDVFVPSTEEKRQLVFLNGVTVDIDDEMKKKIEELSQIRIAASEDMENKLLLRAEALYTQLNGEIREDLQMKIRYFNRLIKKGNIVRRRKAAKFFAEYLDMLKRMYLEEEDLNEDLNEFEKWFEQLEEMDEDEETDEWGDHYYTS